MNKPYVGFYWTLPVKWARYYKLPSGLDAALAKSRTIRYQYERVRRYVAEERGSLIDHIHFMDLRPDRGTGAVVEALARARASCTASQATLIYVDFADSFGWRPHKPMREYLEQEGLDALPLPPDPVPIDGQMFCPITHFQTWRQRHGQHHERRQRALSELINAAVDIPKGPGRYASLAEILNSRGESTASGLPWTATNVRKQLTRHGLVQDVENEFA